MDSLSKSSAATKVQQASTLAVTEAKKVAVAPPPPPPPPAAEPAKSEFVTDKPAKKVTLDPTVGQKSLTELPDLAAKLPKSFSASSLQLTGGKGAGFTSGLSTTEAVSATSTAGASTQAKVEEDSKRIAQEQKKSGAAAGVRTMETLLEERKNEPDFEEYRKQLLIAAEPTLKALGEQARRPQMDWRKEAELTAALESVARISHAAGPEATQRAAKAVAAGMDDSYITAQPGTAQERAFKKMAAGEGGVQFATALSKELAAAGKPGSAEQVGRAAVNEVNTAVADFEAKEKEVQKLNAELQKMVHEAGPALTQEQQQKIAETFRQQHAAKYDEWEKAGAKLTSYLKAPSALEQLSEDPRQAPGLRTAAEEGIKGATAVAAGLSNTEAGAQWIAEEMMKEAKGEKTLLARMGSAAKDDKDLGDKFALALGKGAAWAAMQGAKGGMDLGLVKEALVKYSDVFGLEQKKMAEVVELFGEFKPGMTTEEVREVSLRLNEKLLAVEPGSPFGSEGLRGQALRGVGVAFGFASLTGDWSDFSNASLAEQVKTIGDTINTGADGTALALEMFTKAQSFGALKGIAKVAGPVGGAIAAIGEGLIAIEAFRKGDKGKALESGLLSAGGLFLAAASVQGFPVAGQVLGAALVVAGLYVKSYNNDQDKLEFEQRKKALFAEAFPNDPGFAQALSNADKDQLNKLFGMGFNLSQVQKLGSSYPSLFSDSFGNSLKGLQEMQSTFNMSLGELEAFLHTTGGGDDAAMKRFLQSMDPHLGLATTRTRQEWIDVFKDFERNGPEGTRAAYGRAAKALETRSGATD